MVPCKHGLTSQHVAQTANCLHILSSFEACWVSATNLTHAALHLADGFVFMHFHPIAQTAWSSRR